MLTSVFHHRAMALGLGLLATAAVTLAASDAVSAKADPSAAAGSDTTTLTPQAKSASKAKHGPNATVEQSLEAYWQAMRSAIPADSDPRLAAKGKDYTDKIKQDLAKGNSRYARVRRRSRASMGRIRLLVADRQDPVHM